MKKVIPWILLALCVGFGVQLFLKNRSLNTLLSTQRQELTQAKLEIGRAKTVLAKEKDIHRVAIENFDRRVGEEIKKRQSVATLYADLQLKYRASKHNQKTTNMIVFRNGTSLPVGDLFLFKDNKHQVITSLKYHFADWRITIDGDAIQKLVSYQLHQKFSAKLIETRLPTGDYNHYVEVWELNEKNEPVQKLELTSFSVLKAQEFAPHWMWWNPHLDLQLGLGLTQHAKFGWVGDLGVSFFSYGKTANDLSWRFLRIGAGIASGYAMSFSPVLFNLGSHLPLVSNLWVSPYVAWDFTDRLFRFGVGLGVVL